MHTPTDKERPRNRIVLDAGAGALAGCISRFVVGPLDVIKIRFQVQLEPIRAHPDAPAASYFMQSKYTSFRQAFFTIVKEEGISGLWRGTVPGQLLTIPYTAVQFVALQQCRSTAKKLGLDGNWGPVISFASGGIAGAAGTIASYPFDLLRTTLAAQGEPKVYRGILDATRGIVRQRGVRGLYSGMGVTLVEIIPYASMQFGLYDVFNRAFEARIKPREPGADKSLQHFICGLAAGLVAKLGTHPLDVAKKRYQVAGLQRSLSYGARVEADVVRKGLRHCLYEIWVHEGVGGLWKGSMPSIAKAAPAAAVTFLAYEVIVAWLLTVTTGIKKVPAIGGEES